MDQRIYRNGGALPRVCSFHNSTACPCVAADNAPRAPEPDVVTSAPRIELEIETTAEGAQRLREAHEHGELSEIAGYRLLDIQPAPPTLPAPPPVTADARRAIEQVMLALEEIRTGLRRLQESARTQVTPRELADDIADEIELAGVGALECELALRRLVEPLP